MSDPYPAQETLFSLSLIPLMKGLVSRGADEKFWNQVVRFQSRIRDYVKVLGLELHLDEAEGFAWLAHRPETEGEPSLPRLVPRHRLSYNLSLLLALLRRRLAEQDARGGELRLVMDLEEIQSMMALFLPATGNDTRRRDMVAAQISRAEDLGFLRRLSASAQAWEVQRVLGMFVDAQWLSDFDARLGAYLQSAGVSGSPEEEEAGE